MNSVTNSPAFSPDWIARALGIALPRGVDPAPFTHITTDSRKITTGCLFAAIPGEKFDGHDFIGSALEKGARGLLCRADFVAKLPKIPAGVAVFAVEDTIRAYRQLGAGWRQRFAIPVVAVAGSHGKTTTKELLAALLAGKFPKVLKTQGSQNGFVGIPMTLLELRAEHGAAVVEVGIDEIGAMRQHWEIVRPDSAVLTAIGPEHLEKLKDLDTVTEEETLALRLAAAQDARIFINLDDERIAPLARDLASVSPFRFSLDAVASEALPDARTLVGSVDLEHELLECHGMGLQAEEFPLPLPGRHNAQNLLAAICVALGLGLTAEEIRRGLAGFKGADGRSEIRTLPGPTPVLCDYYNANPSSMVAGLQLLTELAHRTSPTRERWACLGDMLELGPAEDRFHRDLAQPLLALGIEHILLYGPRMAGLQAELRARGFKGTLAHFTEHAALAAELTRQARPGQAILIKGSRGMRMEEVWKRLEPHAREHWSASPASASAPDTGDSARKGPR